VLTVDYNSPEDPYLNAAEAELRSLPIAGEPRPEPVPVTLEACTEHFTAPEEIDDYKCEGCKTVCCQSMRVSLCRLPPVLVIHLKRFKFTEYGSTKINVPVEIPLQLRGSQLQGSQCEWVRDAGAFSLYAVVHHLGSCGGGHYVASVRHRQSGKWYECDDSHCTEVLPEDVQAEASKCGYVLFYAQDETLRCEAGEDAVWEELRLHNQRGTRCRTDKPLRGCREGESTLPTSKARTAQLNSGENEHATCIERNQAPSFAR